MIQTPKQVDIIYAMQQFISRIDRYFTKKEKESASAFQQSSTMSKVTEQGEIEILTLNFIDLHSNMRGTGIEPVPIGYFNMILPIYFGNQ